MNTRENCDRFRLGLACLALTPLFFAGCSPQEKYPEAYGLYYYDGAQWVEIGKNTGKFTKLVPADARFLLFDKRVGIAGSGGFEIASSRFIRNRVPRSWGSQAIDYANAQKSHAWERGDQKIETQTIPVKDRPEMVIVKPKKALPKGVYSVGGEYEYFYVGNDTLMNLEESEFCFDQIAGHIMGNPPTKFVSCLGDPTEQLVKLLEDVLDQKVSSKNVDLGKVEKLLSRGADANASSKKWGGLLEQVVWTDHVAWARLLIEKGANVNARRPNGNQTPLHNAKGVDMVKLLIEKGADVSARDYRGETLMFQVEMPDVIEYLVSKGVDTNVRNTDGETPLSWAEKKAGFLKDNPTRLALVNRSTDILKKQGGK